jgi:Uma2 family endonuclease
MPPILELSAQEAAYHQATLQVRHTLATQGWDAAIEQLLTEDDTPVDNLLSEKLQRFLAQAFYSAYGLIYPQVPFLAAVDVALYEYLGAVPQVPDLFISLGVQVAQDWWQKQHRTYCFWEFDKPPEFVLEIVSNVKGGEDSRKLQTYRQMQIQDYVIFDPLNYLKQGQLRHYQLVRGEYDLVGQWHWQRSELGQMGEMPTPLIWLESLQVGLLFWRGEFEQKSDLWLRWCDRHGQLLLTGDERAEQQRSRAREAEARAMQEETRAREAEARAMQEETRAQEAEARAMQEETRAQEAEARAMQEETRAQEAEARAMQEETRAQEAEARAMQEETRAEAMERRLQAMEAELRQFRREKG